MTATPPLSLSEWVVLALVAEQPTHGFPIAALTASGGELGRIWYIPRPVVYRSLGRLADAGLVTADGSEPGRGPQRTIYKITPAGSTAVGSWLRTPVHHVREVRSHLLMKLALLDRAGADATDLLRRQRDALLPIAHAISAEHTPAAGFEATLLAWRRASADAAMSFLADVTPAP
ncbi:MAG TPA: PadR family transcriptional regulator [Streptosporangiaceae bacterium]|nr:PadR family transcriptional regulator [Streptosporangiaceae bacterium]